MPAICSSELVDLYLRHILADNRLTAATSKCNVGVLGLRHLSEGVR